ncbi:MAG: surface carbohydrate biosynthesis protein [Steroidobacteraceae bacterium]
MKSSTPPLLILPVESQVRELDAKLLFACCAAERGYRVLLGSRAYVHFAMSRLPAGTYVAKSMRGMSTLMFQLMRHLGHDIVGWEEEALVHPPPEVFYPLRLSPATISRLSLIFAWGEDNRQLMAAYPDLPPGLPLHVTGNPRGDLLRPELRGYFDEEAQALKREFGDFVLVNTNFTDVNPFLPSLGLFEPPGSTSPTARIGQAGKGMPRSFAIGLHAHKTRLLESFIAMLPLLERANPGITIVLRPHPSESHEVYNELASRCSRIRVVHRGNVLPWLRACRALLHNGCTTAVEAYAMGVPAVAYLRGFNPQYDLDFQGLPNRLSLQCFHLNDLIARVSELARGGRFKGATEAREEMFDRFVVARDGRLASDRILDVLDAHRANRKPTERMNALARWRARALSDLKAHVTRLYMGLPGKNRADYHQHRFPRIDTRQLTSRIRRLEGSLNRFSSVHVHQVGEHLFEVNESVATLLQ